MHTVSYRINNLPSSTECTSFLYTFLEFMHILVFPPSIFFKNAIFQNAHKNSWHWFKNVSHFAKIWCTQVNSWAWASYGSKANLASSKWAQKSFLGVDSQYSSQAWTHLLSVETPYHVRHAVLQHRLSLRAAWASREWREIGRSQVKFRWWNLNFSERNWPLWMSAHRRVNKKH